MKHSDSHVETAIRLCPMCGGEISSTDRDCPHCGETIRDRPDELTGQHYNHLVQLRKETLTLGISWIVAGTLVLMLSNLLSENLERLVSYQVFLPVMGGLNLLGGLWFVLGILTLLRIPAGLYLGVILTYLAALGVVFVVTFLQEGAARMIGVCVVTLFLMIIMQAHFTVNRVRLLRKANISPNTSPREWEEVVHELRDDSLSN